MKPHGKSFNPDPKIHFKNVASDICNLPPEAFDKSADLMKLNVYKKNEIIINEGDISSKIYFIHKGLIMVYYHLNEDIVIDRFQSEGSFFSGNSSYLTNTPNKYIFETIEKSEMLEISTADFLKLCNDHPEIQTAFSVYLIDNFKKYTDMINVFKGLQSEDKYAKFQEYYAGLANRISLKNISNFLGITQETLSRIRAKEKDQFSKNKK
jgi:CRP-like cAMP-binding protein